MGLLGGKGQIPVSGDELLVEEAVRAGLGDSHSNAHAMD